eukprot:GHVU01124849.1.p1 GENE.GHVU01124849.1~~GHVU01124849.1.p1  ORF type:complete len:141 (-),score=3.84 GHVU01124849.1:596-1018(-)
MFLSLRLGLAPECQCHCSMCAVFHAGPRKEYPAAMLERPKSQLGTPLAPCNPVMYITNMQHGKCVCPVGHQLRRPCANLPLPALESHMHTYVPVCAYVAAAATARTVEAPWVLPPVISICEQNRLCADDSKRRGDRLDTQ